MSVFESSFFAATFVCICHFHRVVLEDTLFSSTAVFSYGGNTPAVVEGMAYARGVFVAPR